MGTKLLIPRELSGLKARREEYDGDAFQSRHFSDAMHEIFAIHERHSRIEQDAIRSPVASQYLQGFGSVGGFADVDRCVEQERERDDGASIFIILDT